MVKLPIGFRFHPTDEELVVHYLKRKALSFPLPASVIPEFDVFLTNPWDLPGDVKERRYFFSSGKGFGNKCRRVTGCGYWKAIGKGIQIVASGSSRAVGMKRTLVFYEGKLGAGTRTQWVMHEYRLVGLGTAPSSTQKCVEEMEDWVVYRVFQKRRRPKRHGVSSQPSTNNNNKAQSIIDLVVENSSDPGPPQPYSPSSSSEISELSGVGLDQEQEGSSAYSCFSSSSYMREH